MRYVKSFSFCAEIFFEKSLESDIGIEKCLEASVIKGSLLLYYRSFRLYRGINSKSRMENESGYIGTRSGGAPNS